MLSHGLAFKLTLCFDACDLQSRFPLCDITKGCFPKHQVGEGHVALSTYFEEVIDRPGTDTLSHQKTLVK